MPITGLFSPATQQIVAAELLILTFFESGLGHNYSDNWWYLCLAQLMSNKSDDRLHFLRDVGYVGDVELQVVEMTGEAGDVYFMDLRMLHTVAPNALQTPRLMLTQRYLLESSRIALYGK